MSHAIKEIMFEHRNVLTRLGLVGVALTLCLSMVACNSSEPAPVIDTSSEAKAPVTPTVNSVAPTGTAPKK
jgi:hypothetical protein